MVGGCTLFGGNGNNFEVSTANLFAIWVERFHHIALIFFCESSKKCKEEEIIVGIFVCIRSNKYEDSLHLLMMTIILSSICAVVGTNSLLRTQYFSSYIDRSKQFQLVEKVARVLLCVIQNFFDPISQMHWKNH